MNEYERLNNMLCHIHKEETDKLDLQEMPLLANERRQSFFVIV